jgi:hypothetical protein
MFYILKPEQAVKLRKDKLVMRTTTMETISSMADHLSRIILIVPSLIGQEQEVPSCMLF